MGADFIKTLAQEFELKARARALRDAAALIVSPGKSKTAAASDLLTEAADIESRTYPTGTSDPGVTVG